MTFVAGNQYWKFRNKHGRDHKYTPDGLWEEAVKYFQWIEENPLEEEKVFCFQGETFKDSINKMRAMTIGGFCLFADIDHKTLSGYKTKDDFFPVVTRIEEIIRTQKFEGAAADLLNPNIIARDLGLKDKQEIEGKVKNENVNYNTEMSKEEIKRISDELEDEV